MTNADWLPSREHAAPTRGLHVAGVDGEFIHHDYPRCSNPECMAYLVGVEEAGLCSGCRSMIDRAEAASKNSAKLKGARA